MTRALAGEVLVTRPVVDAIGESVYLDLEPIGEVGAEGGAGADRALRRHRHQRPRDDERFPPWASVFWPRAELAGDRGAGRRGRGRRSDRPAVRRRRARLRRPRLGLRRGGARGALRAASRSPRSTSTTGSAPTPARTSARPGRSARSSASTSTSSAPTSVAATSRRGPARPATRRPRALRRKLGYDWVATGHTRSDVAETFLYRLAVSPGTRPLLGLAPRSGDVVRPLHSISREETRAVAIEAALPFVDDPSNATPHYARNRIRNEILPRLAEIGPEVERNIAATHAELHEEAELLADVVAEALAAAGAGGGATVIETDELERMAPGAAPPRPPRARRAGRRPERRAQPRARVADPRARPAPAGRRDRGRRRAQRLLRGRHASASPPAPTRPPRRSG